MAKKPARYNREPLSELADGILRKLEAKRCVRYEEVLTGDELREAVLMMRSAVAHARSKIAAKGIPPRTFPWRGRHYTLRYSNAGRVFISTKSGITLMGSDFFSLWE